MVTINQINNTVESEEFELSVIDRLKGLYTLLQSLELSSDIGEPIYQKNAYGLLEEILGDIIDNTISFQKLIAQLSGEEK